MSYTWIHSTETKQVKQATSCWSESEKSINHSLKNNELCALKRKLSWFQYWLNKKHVTIQQIKLSFSSNWSWKRCIYDKLPKIHIIDWRKLKNQHFYQWKKNFLLFLCFVGLKFCFVLFCFAFNYQWWSDDLSTIDECFSSESTFT